MERVDWGSAASLSFAEAATTAPTNVQSEYPSPATRLSSLSPSTMPSRSSTPGAARPTLRSPAFTLDSILTTPDALHALPHHTRLQLIALLEASSKRDLVGTMPVEVGLKILSFLLPSRSTASRYELDEGIRSLVRASAVSTTWRRLARDPSLWRVASEDARMSAWLLESTPREGLDFISLYRHAYCLQKTWAKRKGGKLEGVYYSPDPASVTSLHLLDDLIVNPESTNCSSSTPTIILTLTNPINPQSGRIHIIRCESSPGGVLTPWIRSIPSGGAVWASAISRLPPSSDPTSETPTANLKPGPPKLVTGGCEKILRVWDLETGRCLFMLHGHRSTIRCVGTFLGPPRWKKNQKDPDTANDGNGISPNAKLTEYAISGSRDHTLRVWDIGRGQFVRALTGHTDSVRCLDVHSSTFTSTGGDGAKEMRVRVVSGSYDCSVRVSVATFLLPCFFPPLPYLLASRLLLVVIVSNLVRSRYGTHWLRKLCCTLWLGIHIRYTRCSSTPLVNGSRAEVWKDA
jgi:hypothetical protein